MTPSNECVSSTNLQASISESQTLPTTENRTPEEHGRSNSLTTRPLNVEANIFAPEIVKPFPKAGPRKVSNRGRKRKHAVILTDTPKKNALELEQTAKLKKNRSSKKGRTG